MDTRTYRTSMSFPASYGETVIVRDGNGKAVERWTCVGVNEFKSSKDVTYRQVGYKSAAHL